MDVHLQPSDLGQALRADVRRGLSAKPKFLPPKWLYDERGSEIFDQITRQPEYYPTEAERRLLEKVAPEIAEAARADTLVELGSGTSDKTRTLLDCLTSDGSLQRFVPFDVSEATLRAAGEAISAEYPGVDVHAVAGDFDRHLGEIPTGGRRLVAFLGSTIGNLGPADRKVLLSNLTSGFGPDDHLLLGIDLVKDVGRLEAAYNDAAGVTESFTKNILTVLNRELGADFDPEAFAHQARWDPAAEWIEIGLRSERAQSVEIPEVDMTVTLDEGELIRTEVSSKFRRKGIEAELESVGLTPEQWWDDGDVALVLASRPKQR